MKIGPAIDIFEVAKDLKLAVEYSHDLPASVHGFLHQSDEPRFILVNANDPEFEQRFTIAHEIGHYFIHHNRPPRTFFDSLLGREWQSRRLREVCQYLRHEFAAILNPEWQADLYATGLLIQLGDIQSLKAYLTYHPEKIPSFVVIFIRDTSPAPALVFLLWFNNLVNPKKFKS